MELILCFFQHSRYQNLRRQVNVFLFPTRPSICPVLSLKEYLARTAPLCHTEAITLFIQQCKSHKSVSSQSLAWWITDIMAAAGIDTIMFKQHSTRGAQAAQLKTGSKKMSVAQIYSLAQQSSLTSTYKKFYHKVFLHTGQGQKSSEWERWLWKDGSNQYSS